MAYPMETITLGSTDIQISPLGIGAWSWGDRLFWGYGREYGISEIQAAFDTSLAAGINFIDTAEIYGRGHSERLLGQFLANLSENQNQDSFPEHPLVIGTKFIPLPWRLTKGQLIRTLRGSLKRLNLERIDLYQIHMPLPPRSVETWAEALADAVNLGLTFAVGVSNFNIEQMRRTQAILVKRGVLLASNQMEYHLLNRSVERTGLLDLCHEFGITLIAYSPLAQGILTGKYSPEKPPKGIRGRRYNQKLLRLIQPLIRELHNIGRAHDGKTPAQVALNWVMCKGAVPISGVKTASQARENAGALGWRLVDEEIALLDRLSEKVQIT